MAFEVKKACRSMTKLKLGIAGTSGSGKTLSSTLLGYGLVKAQHPEMSEADVWDKICIIDTENKSANLYTGMTFGKTKIGEYLVIPFEPPFTPQRYLEAIEAAEDAGVEVLIIDSLTHAWAGEGGMLDIQGKASAKTGNSYTAWREVTPLHNRLVDKILQCNMHVIVTMRSKTEYVIEENERGKKTPRKVGMAPIFRDGIEYEFAVMFDINHDDHYVAASKDRTSLFDGQTFIITPNTGTKIYEWLADAKPEEPKPEVKRATRTDAETPQVSTSTKQNAPDHVITAVVPETEPDVFAEVETDLPWEEGYPTQEELTEKLDALFLNMSRDDKLAAAAKIKPINNNSVNYKKVSDPQIRKAILDMFM